MTVKQRGSGWSIKLVFNLYKLFGYKFVYYLMYPVTFFYALVSTNVREALGIYYKHLGLKYNWFVYFEHQRIFAVTMVDRFITKADPASYKFIYDDPKRPLEVLSQATILLFSHFGGWAASSNSSRTKNTMNIVMKESMKEDIKEIEESLHYKETIKVIDINNGPIAVSIAIANALMQNEVVAIMGDRASNPNANMKIEFLGEEAYFNKNPFQIAHKMKKPIMVYFVILTGYREYKVEFVEINMNQDVTAEESIKEAMLIYVRKYEEVLRRYPNQWLNFYDFWKKDVTAS